MLQYLTYGRTDDGIIYRTSQSVVVSNEDRTKNYPYEQIIAENPDVRVLWQHISGASCGIALANHFQITSDK